MAANKRMKPITGLQEPCSGAVDAALHHIQGSVWLRGVRGSPALHWQSQTFLKYTSAKIALKHYL